MTEAQKLAKKLWQQARDYEGTGGFDRKAVKRNPGEGDETWSEEQLQHDLEAMLADLDIHPTVDGQMNTAGSSLTGYSIMEELFMTKLRPFVEGEPIGAIPDGFKRPQTYKRKKREKNDRRTIMAALQITGNHRQDDMLLKRYKNDMALAVILKLPKPVPPKRLRVEGK